ncbi:hypothetical protein EV188_108127 [Actinomycetospora succinea]|uniref:VOC domain-containing protein n=1 Tax=Actinomycetospora succinea TaxID=663603 RepID=A0A4R6UZL9_9PSEU|nr:VOC family protein [Actinomycetospora succinea]TDQ51766.1 hypothetical protein EV188_108127 [Actinomycetospora succinea]
MTGTPCWAELDVEDPEVAAAFYAAVLGWSAGGEVVADHQHRTLRSDDRAVGALGSPGVAAPPAWTLYLRVGIDGGGAVFGLWESDHDVPPPAPGRLCWAEAASAEPGTTRTFYRELLGWRWEEDGAGPGHLAGHGDDGPVAGLGLAGDALLHWLPVFAVTDVDAAVAAAEGAGGQVVAPVAAGPRGRHAALADPAGARFGVLEVG